MLTSRQLHARLEDYSKLNNDALMRQIRSEAEFLRAAMAAAADLEQAKLYRVLFNRLREITDQAAGLAGH